jgi:hypothetical protein
MSAMCWELLCNCLLGRLAMGLSMRREAAKPSLRSRGLPSTSGASYHRGACIMVREPTFSFQPLSERVWMGRARPWCCASAALTLLPPPSRQLFARRHTGWKRGPTSNPLAQRLAIRAIRRPRVQVVVGASWLRYSSWKGGRRSSLSF